MSDTPIYSPAEMRARWNVKAELWANFEQSCSEANIEQFLEETSEIDWVTHCNFHNLDAEFEFVERNNLDPMLIAEDIAYPLGNLESSEAFGLIPLVEAYKAYKAFKPVVNNEEIWLINCHYQTAEKLVHIHCRQAIRRRLGFAPLTQDEIDRFLAKPLYTSLETPLRPHGLSEKTRSEFSDEELHRVVDFLRENYPKVVAYELAVLTKANEQGYSANGWRSVGSAHASRAVVGNAIGYFLPVESWRVRQRVNELLVQTQVE